MQREKEQKMSGHCLRAEQKSLGQRSTCLSNIKIEKKIKNKGQCMSREKQKAPGF